MQIMQLFPVQGNGMMMTNPSNGVPEIKPLIPISTIIPDLSIQHSSSIAFILFNIKQNYSSNKLQNGRVRVNSPTFSHDPGPLLIPP
jgi:hypothetical protein